MTFEAWIAGLCHTDMEHMNDELQEPQRPPATYESGIVKYILTLKMVYLFHGFHGTRLHLCLTVPRGGKGRSSRFLTT